MQEGKMWAELHLGRSGLKPLLGSYKDVKHRRGSENDRHPDERLTIGTNRIFSSGLPPLEGPADIEFLRNKCGWCMPTAEQVIRSQKLTRPKSYALTRRTLHDTSFTASTKSSENKRLQQFWHKHHFTSKTSDQLEREKLISRITEELRGFEKNKAIGAYLYPKKSSESIIEPPPSTYLNFRRKASLFVRHKEIRVTEISKISRRATTTLKSHSVIMEEKLSKQSQHDVELVKRVRSKLEQSKSMDRLEKKSKISRLETQRKKFSHLPSDVYLPTKLEPTSETPDEDPFNIKM